MPRFKPMARYVIPGLFMPEEATVELRERTIDEAIAQAPAGAFAFTTYDLPVVPDDTGLDPALYTVLPIVQNKSAGRYYLGGTVHTIKEVEDLAAQEPDKHVGLVSNLKSFKAERAIKCRTGNWQPFTADDELVEPHLGAEA